MRSHCDSKKDLVGCINRVNDAFREKLAGIDLSSIKIVDRNTHVYPKECMDNFKKRLQDPSYAPAFKTLEQVVALMKDSSWFKRSIGSGLDHCVRSRASTLEPFGEIVSTEIACALKESGLESLYSHQSEAIQALQQGRHVLITTETSSGKSLVYQAGIIGKLEQNIQSCALFLYPTKVSRPFSLFLLIEKALAHDQLKSMKSLLSKIPSLKNVSVDAYDGDTSSQDRTRIRRHSSIILTNMDSIHASLLPYHRGWSDFFKNLKLVAIDGTFCSF